MSVKTIRVTKHPLPQPVVRLVQGDSNTQVLRFAVKKDYGGKDLTGLTWSVWVQGNCGEAEVSYAGNVNVFGDDIIIDWPVIPAATRDHGITIIKLYGSNAGAATKEYAWVSGNMQILVMPTQLIDPCYNEEEIAEVRQLIEDFDETIGSINNSIETKIDNQTVYINSMIEKNKKYADTLIEQQKEYMNAQLEKEKEENAALNASIKNEQVILSSRIESLSRLPDGSTAGDAELLDIRVGVDGNTYASAGTSVRNQIMDVKSVVDEYLGKSKTFTVAPGSSHSSLLDEFPVNIKKGESYYIYIKTTPETTRRFSYYERSADGTSQERGYTNGGLVTARIDVDSIGVYVESGSDSTTFNVMVFAADSMAMFIRRLASEYATRFGVSSRFTINAGSSHSSASDQSVISIKKGEQYYVDVNITPYSAERSVAIWEYGADGRSVGKRFYPGTVYTADFDVERIGLYVNTGTEKVTASLEVRPAWSVAAAKSMAINFINEFKNKAYPFALGNTGDGWKKRINIIHTSDSHVSSQYTETNLEEAMTIADAVYKDGMLNCVINTGDMVNGFTDKETHLSKIDKAIEIINRHIVPHIHIVGNHDSNENSDGTVTEVPTSAELMNHMYSGFEPSVVWGGRNKSGYYYYDVDNGGSTNAKRIRFIMLNMLDHEDYKESDAPYVYKCMWNTVYSQDQIDWLCNTALRVPNGYGVVICNHYPFAPRRENYSEQYPAVQDGSFAQGWTMIPDIVEAWQNRTTLVNEYSDTTLGKQDITVRADFSDIGADAQFVCYLCGHTHSKNAFWVEEEGGKRYNQRMLCEDSTGQNGSGLNRANKTSENDSHLNNAFSMISIDMDTRRIFRTSYGTYMNCNDPDTRRTMVFEY